MDLGSDIYTFAYGPAGATGYFIQVSKNGSFTSLVVNATVTVSTYTPTVNLPVWLLYWRVRTNGPDGPSLWSTRTVTVKET